MAASMLLVLQNIANISQGVSLRKSGRPPTPDRRNGLPLLLTNFFCRCIPPWRKLPIGAVDAHISWLGRYLFLLIMQTSNDKGLADIADK
ncbi:hypothetical protein V5799_025031 [Amblyomma americanum]|uniref:Uncharacterized protein n=1 Tax=Amblyomma americanum TaxID=6943 RepID=A0AAQ4EAH5_AMBAM